MKKNQGAAVASQNNLLKIALFSFLFFSTSNLTLPPPNSTTSELDLLRDKIFSKNDVSGCKEINRHILSSLDEKLNLFLRDLTESLKRSDSESLTRLFHPRLKNSTESMQRVFSQHKSLYGTSFDVSLYKLFALLSNDQVTQSVPCSDAESIFPLYGYSLQFGVWLQISGKKEIGRLFASVVYRDQQWFLGSFQSQQWTHSAMDYEKWLEGALKDFKENRVISSFVKAKTAEKLSSGFKFIELKKDSRFTSIENEKTFQKVKDKFVGQKILDMGSFFLEDGVGLLLRVELPSELPGPEVSNNCKEMAKSLSTSSLEGILGLRCSYVVKGEDPKKEGRLGSLFIPF